LGTCNKSRWFYRDYLGSCVRYNAGLSSEPRPLLDVCEDKQRPFVPCAKTKPLLNSGHACAGPGLDLTKLAIISGKQCWVVYVDVLLLAVAGPVLDTVSLAVKVGLAAAAMPM